jgi:hypothetical protein
MKRLPGLSTGLSICALVAGALLVVASTNDAGVAAPQGIAPIADSLWVGISGGDGGAGFCDDSSDDIFEALILTGGWASRLDTDGNGDPSYTVFQPYDQVLSDLLDALGLEVGDLNSQPAVVASILADHIANGAFDEVELEDADLTRITMRSGYVATFSSAPSESLNRVMYDNVYINGAFIQAGSEYANGWLYCIQGIIDSTPVFPIGMSWTSPTSPTSSRHLLFELSFTKPVLTVLIASDFENLGSQKNCQMYPVPENGNGPSYRYFLIVSCTGTGTVSPRLTATELDVVNDASTDTENIEDEIGGATVDIVNGVVLTVEKTGLGQGTVTSNLSGIDCGVMCVGVFSSRTRITLTATAEPGNVFTGWSGACSGLGNCQLTLNASTSAVAHFEPAAQVVVNGVGNGFGLVTSTPARVNCPVSSKSLCNTLVLTGVQLTVQARANRGSRFLGWMGACTGTGACNIWTESPEQIIHVFAIFERT